MKPFTVSATPMEICPPSSGPISTPASPLTIALKRNVKRTMRSERIPIRSATFGSTPVARIASPKEVR